MPISAGHRSLIERFIVMEAEANRAGRAYLNAYRTRFEETIDLALRHAPPPARVLDVAGGNGHISLCLSELGYDVTWLDLRGELTTYIRERQKHGRIRFLVGNVFDEGLVHGGAYDVVVATEVIEHCAHPDEFLDRLATLLPNRGTILLSTPNGGYFLNDLPKFSDCPDPSLYEAGQFLPDADGHIFALHPEELLEMSQARGLSVREFRLCTNPLTAGHVKLRHLLPLLPLSVLRAVEWFTRRLPRRISKSLHTTIVAALRRDQG